MSPLDVFIINQFFFNFFIFSLFKKYLFFLSKGMCNEIKLDFLKISFNDDLLKVGIFLSSYQKF